MTDRLAEIKLNHDRAILVHKAMGIDLPRHRDEIVWLLSEVDKLRSEVDRLNTLNTQWEHSTGCGSPELIAKRLLELRPDAERWRYVLEHADHILWDDGSATTKAFNGNREEFTAAVDAARKAT